jgi:hypothetical protein
VKNPTFSLYNNNIIGRKIMTVKQFCDAIMNMTITERDFIFLKLEEVFPNQHELPDEHMEIIEEIFIENNIEF